MNELTVEEYLENRQQYREHGRASEGSVAQQAARDKAYADKIAELQKSGVPIEEAEQWERDFLQQQQRNLDINFENFVQTYYEDMEHRLRENTMHTKKFIIDLKIIPYFRKKNMNEIKASDIRAWQNALMKKGYSETYLKTVNNQLSAIFNYAVRYYDLKDNPCKKAGSIGKSHAGEKEFWTKRVYFALIRNNGRWKNVPFYKICSI